MSNSIRIKLCDVITHPCYHFAKPPLKLRQGWVITSRGKQRIVFCQSFWWKWSKETASLGHNDILYHNTGVVIILEVCSKSKYTYVDIHAHRSKSFHNVIIFISSVPTLYIDRSYFNIVPSICGDSPSAETTQMVRGPLGSPSQMASNTESVSILWHPNDTG